MLAALGRQRQEAPGVGMSRDELFEVGWPQETITGRHAANRVYVALSTLRKLGLGQLIKRLDSGYGLDPDAPLLLLDQITSTEG